MAEESKVPRVDPNLCIGCGLCAQTCPDTFQLGDDGKSFVKDAAGCKKCNCQEAMDNCPSHAISWVEE
jgi:ferredoxin